MEIKQSKYPVIRLEYYKITPEIVYLYEEKYVEEKYRGKNFSNFDSIFEKYIKETKYPHEGWVSRDTLILPDTYVRIYMNILDKPKFEHPSSKFNVGDMVYITKDGINSNKFRIKSIETIHMCGKYHNQYYFNENRSKESFIGWEENLTLWTTSW